MDTLIVIAMVVLIFVVFGLVTFNLTTFLGAYIDDINGDDDAQS